MNGPAGKPPSSRMLVGRVTPPGGLFGTQGEDEISGLVPTLSYPPRRNRTRLRAGFL
jgi:hypothetical protein